MTLRCSGFVFLLVSTIPTDVSALTLTGETRLASKLSKSPRCDSWCTKSQKRTWSEKCAFKNSCGACVSCTTTDGSPTPTPAPTPGICNERCAVNKRKWSSKCTWRKYCDGCSECNVQTPEPTPPPTVANLPHCHRSCHTRTQDWTKKCRWQGYCSGCSDCDGMSVPTPPPSSPTVAPTVAHLSLQQVMTCPSGAADKTPCMCRSMYDDIVGDVTQIMAELKQIPCIHNECKVADFAGCVLRAAGHDFMDFRDGVGGSDGCLRFDDPDNKGLINCLNGDYNMDGNADPEFFDKTLIDVYHKFCSTVSLADFMVIAGQAVMGFTETSEHVDLKLEFKEFFMYGRTTAATCANAVALPNPADGCSANEVTFLAENAFGLSWRQTAALMGVHSLGRARKENSGFEGWWGDRFHNSKFDNHYYVSIVNHGWSPAKNISDKWQWDRSDMTDDDPHGLHPMMMLNTDMCLVYKDVRAESSRCCAWERFGSLRDMNITQKEGGRPFWCGQANANESTFIIEHAMCCLTGLASCDASSGTSEDRVIVPKGPAVDAVHEFAANEDVWLSAFLSVWKIVTEKGFETSELKPLSESCEIITHKVLGEFWGR